MTDFSCSERQSRRVVIHRPGGYEQLRLERGPLPRPAAGEQLVATRAIGVNYADCVVRMGLYASARKYVGWPITPGFELVGRPHDVLTQAPVIAFMNASCWACIASKPGILAIGFIAPMFSIIFDCPSRSISKLACRNCGTTLCAQGAGFFMQMGGAGTS